MKIKRASKPGRVSVELGRQDTQLLAAAAAAAPSPSPFQLKKILVPIDFSACSRKALQYALPLARQFGAELVLLHVVPPTYYSTDLSYTAPVFPEDEVRDFTAQKLAALTAAQIGDQVPGRSVVRIGQPVHEIVETARELKIDLIIVSTHGNTGLKHLLLGSVAENVVRHAPCPVLVVREHEHEFLSRTTGRKNAES